MTRSLPEVLRVRARQAWLFRWSSLLACSAARAHASSLLELHGCPGCRWSNSFDLHCVGRVVVRFAPGRRRTLNSTEFPPFWLKLKFLRSFRLFDLLFVLPRRSVMPRGWKMPNGWWHSLPGATPPSESWPRVWESNGRSTSAVQKTPKVQGRVQCFEAAVAALRPEGCNEDRDRGRIATSQGREGGGSIAPAHPLDSRRCPGAGASQGHQARTSSSSLGRFEVCRGRHVAGSFKASSPISARTSSRQSNFRVHTFHQAVDTSPRKDRRTGGGGGSSRRGTFPSGASRSSIQDVPTRCAHEHCHQQVRT